MVDGPRIIQDGFDKVGQDPTSRLEQAPGKPRVLTDAVFPSIQTQGKPFEIYTPENRYVFVSSRQHIMELDAALDSVMSLHESAKQVSTYPLATERLVILAHAPSSQVQLWESR